MSDLNESNLIQKPLSEFSQEDIKATVTSAKTAIDLLDNIYLNLQSFKQAKSESLKFQFRDLIQQKVAELELGVAFNTFIKLFNITCVDYENKPKKPELFEIIPIIQETNTPSLPWDTSFGNLYINAVEDQYLTLGQQFKSKTVRSDVYAKNVLIAPAEFKNVFNLMRQETQSLRCREILDIYCALKLVEDLEDYSVEINDLKNPKISTNGESKESSESLKIFKQEITTLCIKYFKEFKKQLNTQDYKIPEKKTDWNELLLLNYSLRDAMIKFRLKDIKLIENYSLDTNEILCKDIRAFLISKDKSQLELPSSHVISKIDQGHGLVKKIGKLRNYKYMQDTYSAWIVKKIEEEGYYHPNNQKSTTSENISDI